MSDEYDDKGDDETPYDMAVIRTIMGADGPVDDSMLLPPELVLRDSDGGESARVFGMRTFLPGFGSELGVLLLAPDGLIGAKVEQAVGYVLGVLCDEADERGVVFCCKHVPFVERVDPRLGGAPVPVNVCGDHPEIGLMCADCVTSHVATHASNGASPPCSACGASRPVQLAGLYRPAEGLTVEMIDEARKFFFETAQVEILFSLCEECIYERFGPRIEELRAARVRRD